MNKNLIKILDDLEILYTDLNRLIAEYEIGEWDTTASASWKTQDRPFGLISDSQHIYICILDTNLILKYNLNNNKNSEQITSIKAPSAIDVDYFKSLLYIAGKHDVTLLDLNNDTVVSSWNLPVNTIWKFRGIKIDGSIIYLTLRFPYVVFLCDSNNGKVLKKFGNENEEQVSSKQGEFNQPCGITVNIKYLYICDNQNHRIQVLTKDKGIFKTQWGKHKQKEREKQGFFLPYSIFYDEKHEKIFYIGDRFSVSLWTDGECFRRLGDQESGRKMNQFDAVFGICKTDDRLFVSDFENKRIQIFRRT